MDLFIKTLISFVFLFSVVCAQAQDELPDIPVVTETVEEPDFSQTTESLGEEKFEVEETAVETMEVEAKAAVEEMADVVTETAVITEDSLKKDVILMLDNSGSMKKNDPDFLAKQAAIEFIRLQDEATRVAIIIFDQNVQLAVPLTEASLDNRDSILSGLDLINYKGLFTDSPAGIERAIYELKINGREDAQKVILFMTDGIVDTGDADRDLEKAKWLKDDLAPDAADNNIRIFGVAYTEGADFELIQSIAQNTDGEYYRALTTEDLQNVFKRINTIISTPPEPEPIEVVVPVTPVEPPPVPVQPQVVAPPPPPVIIEVPVQTMGEEERIRSMVMIAAAIILIITLVSILILLLKRNREIKANEEVVQEAYLNDLQGKTDSQTHKLGNRPVMMGRVAGKDTEHLDYIVVNESTIGRRHALIEYKDYSFWLIDQGSINGTFVNGEPVQTEVRLKHGDRIRLHKCDFEFVMPEMEDSGMTVISNTVFAGGSQDADISEEATEIRGGHEVAGPDAFTEEPLPDNFDLDIDITGAAGPELPEDDFDTEEDTVIRDKPAAAPAPPTEAPMDNDLDSEDETIMLDDDDAGTNELDEDATIRKDEEDPDDFFKLD